MLSLLNRFALSSLYWWAAIIVGLSLEGIALYYQYVLDEPPCVYCIHVRVWVLLGIVSALLGLLTKRYFLAQLTAHTGLITALGLFTYTSRKTVLIERGLYEGQCGMDAGFPAWFALDEWFPALFEVWTMCGYTPNFLFGLTMGEGLVYGGWVLTFIAVVALVSLCLNQRQRSKNWP